VNAINLQIQKELSGETTSYKSVDTVTDVNEAVQYHTEFLNSFEPSGMPLHNLLLKIGSPIMLLRNLDAPRLRNGARLCVKSLMPHVIEATILTGCAKSEDVFISRIPMVPTDMPFEFKRLQFPVCLTFAMSINKAQR
jgi:ATP-dependent DNA helicase PIF1